MKYATLFLIISLVLCFSEGCKLFRIEQSEHSKIETAVSRLEWCYGGYNGSKSIQIQDNMISDLRVDSNNLYYSWLIPESEATTLLGLNVKTDASLLACFFVTTKSGNIRGGKFEWISVSRKSRSFGNIFAGYNGWQLSDVPSTSDVYFCILNPKTNRRTNFIKATWIR